MFNKNILCSLYDISKLSLNTNNEDVLLSELNMFSKDMQNIKDAKTTCTPFMYNHQDYNELRLDTVKTSASQEEITLNSKDVKENCFTVPKIV